MSKSAKKFKKDENKKPNQNPSPTFSGNFMISYFHEQHEENDEIPIASPDATCNEVPVKSNDLKDDFNSTSNGHSLKNLIHYIKSNYSPNINTPKWKNFNGLKLKPQDKIRLNNVIWRTWFQQYGIKDPCLKRKKPLICQFSNATSKSHLNSQVIAEGKDWSKLDSVSSEYKKWREFSRKKITKALMDLEIYNFSDTLFTPYIDDPKDPLIGNNPDLFQPELMKFFPNFDFLDIDFDDFDCLDMNSTTNHNSFLNAPNNSSHSSNNNNNNNNNNTHLNPDTISNTSGHIIEIVPAQQTNNVDPNYNGLANIDTLATVAAQASHLHNQTSMPFSKHNQEIKSNNTQNLTRHASFHTRNPDGLAYQQNRQVEQTEHVRTGSNTIRNLLTMQSTNISKNNGFPLNNVQSTVDTAFTNNATSTKFINQIQHPKKSPQTPSSAYSNTNLDGTTEVQYPLSSYLQNPTLGNLLLTNTATVQMMPTETNRINQHINLNASNFGVNLKDTIHNSLMHNQIQPSHGLGAATLPTISRDSMVLHNHGQLQTELTPKHKHSPKAPRIQKTKQVLQQAPLSDQHVLFNSTSALTNGSSNNHKSIKLPDTHVYMTAMSSHYEQTASPSNLLLSDINSSVSPSSATAKKIIQNSIFQENQASDNKFFHTKPNKAFVHEPTKLSRSDSLPNFNSNDSVINCSSAEQKRRNNIQNGFDRIQKIVPALNENKNSKISKAQMLQKTAEYIRELQDVHNQTADQLKIYKDQIEILSQQINELQNELPESGVSLTGPLNKHEKFQQKFASYVQQRTIESWKFYIFSMVLKPLFDSYVSSVNTSSDEQLKNSMNDWQNKHCNLSQMRRNALDCLRELSKTTSILNDPNKIQQECYSAALSKL